jgi:hypothetical protein
MCCRPAAGLVPWAQQRNELIEMIGAPGPSVHATPAAASTTRLTTYHTAGVEKKARATPGAYGTDHNVGFRKIFSCPSR